MNFEPSSVIRLIALIGALIFIGFSAYRHLLFRTVVIAVSNTLGFVGGLLIYKVIPDPHWLLAPLLGFGGFILPGLLIERVWPCAEPSSKCPCGEGLYPECLNVLMLEGNTVVLVTPEGEQKAICLENLKKVVILTNDSGPAGADLWWHLVGSTAEASLAFPEGATGYDAIVERLQGLPGFRFESVLAALTCTENRRFLCWQSPSQAQEPQT